MLKSHLSLHRPYITFDVSNPVHREAYYNFHKKSTWKGCPFTFVLEEGYSTIPSMITAKMSEYYMAQEFKKPRVRAVKKKTLKNQ